MNRIEVVELCPYCECENSLEVSEDTWIAECEECGRPILLCDKCEDHDCGKCPHERELKSRMRKWKRSRIGRLVYWNDPDNGLCSAYYWVKGFTDDDMYILENGEGSIVKCYDGEVELIAEDTSRPITERIVDCKVVELL